MDFLTNSELGASPIYRPKPKPADVIYILFYSIEQQDHQHSESIPLDNSVTDRDVRWELSCDASLYLMQKYQAYRRVI